MATIGYIMRVIAVIYNSFWNRLHGTILVHILYIAIPVPHFKGAVLLIGSQKIRLSKYERG